MTPRQIQRILSQFSHSISGMSPEERLHEAHKVVNDVLPYMSEAEVRELANRARTAMLPDVHAVESTVNMIEGHLALREIQRETLND